MNIAETAKAFREAHASTPRLRRYGEYWSGETYECRRQWWRKVTTLPVYDDKKAGVFEAGDAVEDYIRRVLEWAAKNKPELEVVIPQRSMSYAIGGAHERLIISGKSDFLLLLRAKNSSDTQLVEVKSAYSIVKILAPKKDHLVQITPYQYVLNPTSTSIIYVDKNNFSKVKEFDNIPYNPNLMEWIEARVKDVHTYVQNMIVPFAEALYCHVCKKAKLKIDHTTKDANGKRKPKMAFCPACRWEGRLEDTELWRCKYCPFREWCFKLEADREKLGKEELLQLEAGVAGMVTDQDQPPDEPPKESS